MRREERGARLRAMKTVLCSCGYAASGETGEQLLADVEAHIEAAHARAASASLTAAPAGESSTASSPRETAAVADDEEKR